MGTLSKRWWIISVILLVPGVIMVVTGILNPQARTNDGVSDVLLGII